MNPNDLNKLHELTLLLDLAYLHHFEGDAAGYKSAEGSIRLDFGNLWFRRNHQAAAGDAPIIESVVLFSSVFSANRILSLDSLDDALTVVQGWYDQARERNENRPQ